jgi:hypothetical protein
MASSRPNQFAEQPHAALVVDLCPNRCDHLGVNDAPALGVLFVNFQLYRDSLHQSDHDAEDHPKNLVDFFHRLDLNRLKLCPRVPV